MRSQFASLVADEPLDEAAFIRLAGRCWRDRGVAFVRPETIDDPQDRAAVIRAADRLYGQRRGNR